jgi:ABC-type branched-subunit amino acid transport system ATPase component
VAPLELNGVSVDFGGVHALRDVSFAVEAGTIVGLIGPNGAGKSTLLNCVSGLTRPTAGNIHLDGIDVATLAPSQIAYRGVARVFQHPEVMPELSVLENLMVARHRFLRYSVYAEILALPSARRAEADARAAVGRVTRAVGLPADCLGLPAGKLPYGHRKLLELGRAMLLEAKLFLLDEPVAGLNEQEVDALARLVLGLRGEGNVSVLLVEHNMGLVDRLCDRVIVLDAGATIAVGTPTEVLADPKVRQAYLGEGDGDA